MFLRKALINGLISKKSLQLLRNISTTQIFNIELRENLPRGELFISPGQKIDIGDKFTKRRVVIVGVIGAFTPACSNEHMPPYIKKSMEIKTSFCVDEIICISVNDAYVMQAWAKELEAGDKVTFLADPNGAYVTELDLTEDLEDLGGIRSKRFSLIAYDSIITELNVEPDLQTLEVSLADYLGHTMSKDDYK